jgi:lipoprotein NlpD
LTFDASLSHCRRIAACAAIAVIAGCASRVPAPVVERAPLPPPSTAATAAAPTPEVTPPSPPPVPTYTVKRGDTLRTIAQDRGLDTRQLAAWNNLDNPNRLAVGQVLRLGPPASEGELPAPGATDASGPGVTTAPLRTPPPVGAAPGDVTASAGVAAAPSPGARNTDNFKTSPKAIKQPYSAEAMRDFGKLAQAAPPADVATAAPTSPRAASTPANASPPPIGADEDRLDWMWPAKGRVVGTFSDTANLKGIDIAGSAGTPVVASAAGKVVYAGAGLRGYGKLVIIKHNDTYLSAYAHNRSIVVKEGDEVARGQKIAEMGNTDADQVMLHFEIRRLGKPMDPARYLPPPG